MSFLPGHLEMVVSSYHTLGRNQISVDKLQQCGLSSSIGTNQGKSGVQIHPELQVLVDEGRVLVVSEADVLYHDDGGRDLSTRVEVE